MIDDNPDDNDIKCAAYIIISYGNLLNEQSITDTTSLVMKSRNLLCSTTIEKSEDTNNLLLAINDLWNVNWNKNKLPEILQLYHDERCSFIDYFSHYNRHISTSNVISHRSRSSSGYESPVRTQSFVVPKKSNCIDPIDESMTPVPSEYYDNEPETTV